MTPAILYHPGGEGQFKKLGVPELFLTRSMTHLVPKYHLIISDTQYIVERILGYTAKSGRTRRSGMPSV